jgi:hypothetical protein
MSPDKLLLPILHIGPDKPVILQREFFSCNPSRVGTQLRNRLVRTRPAVPQLKDNRRITFRIQHRDDNVPPESDAGLVRHLARPRLKLRITRHNLSFNRDRPIRRQPRPLLRQIQNIRTRGLVDHGCAPSQRTHSKHLCPSTTPVHLKRETLQRICARLHLSPLINKNQGEHLCSPQMHLAQQTRYFRYRFVLHQLGCRHSGHATVSPATSEDVISTDADHVCRCRSSSTQTKNRHFDRSCSRFCEQRSGEIRFSTTLSPLPTPRSCLCLFSFPRPKPLVCAPFTPTLRWLGT